MLFKVYGRMKSMCFMMVVSFLLPSTFLLLHTAHSVLLLLFLYVKCGHWFSCSSSHVSDLYFSLSFFFALPTVRLSRVCIFCEWQWSFWSWKQLLAFTDWKLLWWNTVMLVPKHQSGSMFSIFVALFVILWECSLDCIPCCGDKGCPFWTLNYLVEAFYHELYEFITTQTLCAECWLQLSHFFKYIFCLS
jgi:hypothetical protein